MHKRKYSRRIAKQPKMPVLIKIKSTTGNWSFTNTNGSKSAPALVQ